MNEKVKIAIERIRCYSTQTSWWPRIAVAYSGGKDSDVILELAKRSGIKFEAVMNLTSVDMPPVVWYVRQQHPEVKIVSPSITMFQLIPKHALMPLRQKRFCCKYLKERKIICDILIDGVRWDESGPRKKRQMFEAARDAHGRMFFLHPIIDWTEDDVWRFILDNNLPHCFLYHEGIKRNGCRLICKRIGCVGCPYAGENRKLQFEIWPEYKRGYIKAAQAMIDRRNERIRLGLTDAPPFAPWQTGEEVFEWWINEDNKIEPSKCEGGESKFMG
jgi:phosphoadenosine phosphosulfate reductase